MNSDCSGLCSAAGWPARLKVELATFELPHKFTYTSELLAKYFPMKS